MQSPRPEPHLMVNIRCVVLGQQFKDAKRHPFFLHLKGSNNIEYQQNTLIVNCPKKGKRTKRGSAHVDYKKAMLMFYEQNNIVAFKQIFIEQYEFAVKNYF